MTYRVIINDIECEFKETEDLTILQACLANGIEIPRFCYHEKLTIAGNCRMCLVYVTNEEKLLAACGVPLNEEFDDVSIETEIDEILQAREGVMEFLLINHPLDCPICDQGGECDLQEQTINYGLDTGRFYIKKRAVEVKTFGKLIKGIMTRCIHCTRCVRFLTEVAGVNDLGVLGRGYHMEIGTYKTNNIIDSEVSGNIIDLCPVGALTSAIYAFKGRPWELKNHKVIDIFDTLLTSINFQVKGGAIFRILPKINDKVNEEWITDKVRFHYESYKIIDKIRQDSPTFKISENKYIEISWQSALKVFYQLCFNTQLTMDFILGPKISPLNIQIYKTLLTKLGVKNRYLESMLNMKHYNYDLRENFLMNNDLSQIAKNDLIILLGINLRVESPLLNIKLRQLNFIDDDLDFGRQIAIIGNKYEWRNESHYLGSKLGVFFNILEGRHDYCKKLSKSKNPLMVVGTSFFLRTHISMQQIRQGVQAVIKAFKSENFMFVAQGANFAAACEFGFFKEQSRECNIQKKWLYTLDSNEFKVITKPTFIIYQGVINDKINSLIDLYLPSKFYFEDFMDDRSIYINQLGQMCELEKLKITIKNRVKETSLIGSIQLFYLNKQVVKNIKESSESLSVIYQTFNMQQSMNLRVNKYLTLNNLIENYYKTDILSRYSKNLMSTAENLIEKNGIAKQHWKVENK